MNQCKDCGKQISLRAKRCGSCAMQVRGRDPETRRKRSEDAKAQWQDPEVRRKRCEAARVRGQDPEVRRKRSEDAKARWERGDFDTPEVCRKKSESLKAAHARGDFDKPETRHKMSEAAKKHWEDPKSRRKLSEIRTQAWKDGVYDRVFLSPTSIELATTAALDACGLEHITQYRPDGHGRIYDEFVPPNILIEVHGDYWHGPQKPKAKVRDAEKAAWAKENGYHLVVIWEHEIKEQSAQALVIERVKPLLAEMRGDESSED